MSVRRQVKNVVKNYSHAEVLVREATSNDPWGPSSSVMTEIADATYNVVEFSEIMGMIWKRLNDHGKNWRHVYKSLVVLDYIIKTGSERVAQQCRENIFAIQTLKDFQFVDKDGKDQGMNVREKAKQLVALLKDEDRMKTERARALKAKERFAQASSGIGSDSRHVNLKTSGSASDIRSDGFRTSTGSTSASRSWEPERKVVNNEIENCRPSNSNEEELQLQLALALSKQEAEESTKLDQRENERVQLAISKSQTGVQPSLLSVSDSQPGQAQDPWGSPQVMPAPQPDPWGGGAAAAAANPPAADPWAGTPAVSQPQFNAPPDPWGAAQPSGPLPTADPWGGTASSAPAPSDPWGTQFGQPQPQPPPQGLLTSQPDPWAAPGETQFNGFNSGGMQQNQLFSTSSSGAPPADLFDLGSVRQSLPAQSTEKPKPKLDGDLTGLVDLGSLTAKQESRNPFFSSSQLDPSKSTNPFKQDKPQQPTLNQLRVSGQATMPASYPAGTGNDTLLPAPLVPSSQAASSASNNPFL